MDLTEFFTIVRSGWRVIITVTLTAAAVAFLLSALMPKQYDAEARVLVGSLTDTSPDKLAAYQQLGQTYAQLALTTPVLSSVAVKLGLSEDPLRLGRRTSVRVAPGDNIVRIVASDSSPTAAAQLANAVAGQIIVMAKPSGGAPSLASIVQPALPPESPSTPRVSLNVTIAAALGLAMGIGLVLLLASRRAARDRLGDRQAYAARS